MNGTKYIRNGSTITSVAKNDNGDPVEVRQHESINAAKRTSWDIQMSEDGALGRGSVITA